MNQQYYDLCGKQMIDSYLKHSNIPLYVYNEDFDIPGVVNQGWNLGDEYNKFQQRWSGKQRIQTFAKKAYSIIHALNHINADYIFWFDADTILTKDFDKKIIKQLANKHLSAHFGVMHNGHYSCETGFFVLNCNHPEFKDFKNQYTDIYNNDDYKNLRRFYDGDVYGYVVDQLQKLGTPMLELNPNPNKYKTPIKRSILAEYLKHYKSKSSKIELKTAQ
jgi:hypothetical protein